MRMASKGQFCPSNATMKGWCFHHDTFCYVTMTGVKNRCLMNPQHLLTLHTKNLPFWEKQFNVNSLTPEIRKRKNLVLLIYKMQPIQFILALQSLILSKILCVAPGDKKLPILYIWNCLRRNDWQGQLFRGSDYRYTIWERIHKQRDIKGW